MQLPILPQLDRLPDRFTLDAVIGLELIEGIPLFRASNTIRDRIQTLLDQPELQASEEAELDDYEILDDYLSWVNRIMRNLYLGQYADVEVGRHPPNDDPILS